MNFIKFLISKAFLKNLLAAIILTIVIVLGFKLYLNFYTHHNEYHIVPDLHKKSFSEAKKILEGRKMHIQIIDTIAYNPNYPKYSIVEQDPHKNDKVKVGRKIYVKINNNAYENITIPNVLGKTKRQAKSLLSSSGFNIGKITTRPYFAEVVLYAICQKDTLKSGSKLPKTSTIDLIIGDGNRPIDSEGTPQNETGDEKLDKNIQNTLNNVIGN